jgi:hypothetical protein
VDVDAFDIFRKKFEDLEERIESKMIPFSGKVEVENVDDSLANT